MNRIGVFLIASIACLVLHAPAGAAPAAPKLTVADLPAAVQKVVKEQVADGKIGEIVKSVEPGSAAVYDVRFSKDKKTRTFSVDDQGNLLRKLVFLAETPPAAQKTIRKQLGRGHVKSIDKVFGDDGATFEVEFTLAGKTRDFALTENGVMLSRKIFPNEVPAVVRPTIKEQAGQNATYEVYRTFEDGEVFYRVELTKNGSIRDFNVASDGTLVNVQVFIQETPGVVQKTIREQSAGGKLGDIYKTYDDDEFTFVAEFVKNSKSRSLTVGPDGKLQNLQIDLTEAPEAIQKVVREQMGAGAVDEVYKIFSGSETAYEVESTKDERKQSLSIKPDGTLTAYEIEVVLESVSPAVQKIIKERVEGNEIETFKKNLEDGDVFFEAVSTKGGKRYAVSVGEDGEFISEEIDVALKELPAEAQQAVKQRLGKGKIASLRKVTEDGPPTYDVEIIKDGKRQIFSIGADGKPVE